MLAEWADLIIAGFLFIEGKKAILSNQTIMELRSIDRCSPSFVGRCQIIYMGRKVVSKWNKLEKILPKSHHNYHVLKEVLTELMGIHL